MNWLVRFHFRNDTPQKWFEILTLSMVVGGVIVIAFAVYFGIH